MSEQIHSLINSLSALKRTKKELDSKVTAIEKDISRIEATILGVMSEAELTRADTEKAYISLDSAVYPSVTDWDKFWDYIIENRYVHMLERRPTVLAYREQLELGRPVPGVVPFTKTKVIFKEK